MKLKEYAEKAQELIDEGVNNAVNLHEALPILVEGLEAVKAMRRTLAAMSKNLGELADLCTEYALERRSVFLDGVKERDGVLTGDVEVDGTVYHMSAGYDGYVRADGNNLTKEFLESLPDGWTRQRIELDTAAIKEDCSSSDDLGGYGLAPKPKNVWSYAKTDVVYD